jgi:purine nucleosidase
VRTAEETRLSDQMYGKPAFLGAYSAPDAPAGWDKVDPSRVPEGLPKSRVGEENAAQFMIRMVHAHPHQVTIVALGPLTNVALACRLDPHFSELTEELVLMGGSLNPQTEAAEWINRPRHEFNFWFDPEASSITLREKWAKVTTTTIDVSLKTRAEPEVLDGLAKGHSAAAQWVTRYTTRPLIPNYLWDEMAVAAWIDPSLIRGDRMVYMDVATDHGADYGDTLIYTDADKPTLTPSRVRAITDVDLSRLQKMIVDRLSVEPPGR